MRPKEALVLFIPNQVVKKKPLPLITIIRMARDTASGLLHLHKEHIVHRDIAARNVLVGQNYGTVSQSNSTIRTRTSCMYTEVYVADFGMARVQIADGQVATTKQNFGPIAVRSSLEEIANRVQ